MLTYTNALNLYQTFTKNTSTANQTTGAQFLNDSIRTICSLQGGKWPFLEVEEEVQTVANQDYVVIPNNIRKVMSFRYTQGDDPNTDATYIPRVLFDSEAWERVLAARLGTSNWPWYAYQKDRNLLFRPIPSQDGNLISLRGRVNLRDLSIADYTTGTIVSVPLTQTLTGAVASGDTSATLSSNWTLATGVYTMFFDSGEHRLVVLTNGAATVTWSVALTEAATTAVTVGTSTGGDIVTGTGTTFTLDMVGRYIRITNTTAANGGDGFWYKIGAYYSATVIGLTTPYQGTSIVAGTAAYTLGQVSILPEAYQIAPVYRSAALYWGINNPANPNTALANYYWRLYDGGVEAGLTTQYGGLIGQMLEEANESQEGPYMAPLPRRGDAVPDAIPFFNPWQQAGGL